MDYKITAHKWSILQATGFGPVFGRGQHAGRGRARNVANTLSSGHNAAVGNMLRQTGGIADSSLHRQSKVTNDNNSNIEVLSEELHSVDQQAPKNQRRESPVRSRPRSNSRASTLSNDSSHDSTTSGYNHTTDSSPTHEPVDRTYVKSYSSVVRSKEGPIKQRSYRPSTINKRPGISTYSSKLTGIMLRGAKQEKVIQMYVKNIEPEENENEIDFEKKVKTYAGKGGVKVMKDICRERGSESHECSCC